MTGHTAEPLHTLIFQTSTLASHFIDAIRQGISSDAIHRHTPPGPLVIYGPRQMASQGPVRLFATVGILRAAEIMQLALPERGPALDGAGFLPNESLVLLAGLGGSGVE